MAAGALRIVIALAATYLLCIESSSGDTPHAQDPPAFETSISQEGRPILLRVEIANKEPVEFLLDTGAEITVFDSSLKEGGSQRVGSRTFQTAEGQLRLDTYQCPVAKIGFLDLQTIGEIVFTDLSAIRGATGHDVRGILGVDFIGTFAVEVDFDHGIFRLWHAAPPAWDEVSHFPIVNLRGTPHLECSLPGGRREFFAVDTGADISTLRTDVFDPLVEDRHIRIAGDSAAAAAGGYVRSSSGILSSIELASFRHRDVRVDRSAMSVLGLQYLSRFNVRLDLPKKRAYLKPSDRFSAIEGRATSRMTVLVSDGRKVVTDVQRYGAAHSAGVLPGDVLDVVNGQAVADADMFSLQRIFTSEPGARVELVILRGSQRIATTLILQARD
jgi:hypothetical protein